MPARPLALALATLLATPLALAATAAPSGAQAAARARWREIGRTGNDNPVEIDERSMRREGTITTATLRVRFVKPVRSPKGPLTSARTVAMFDCAGRKVAVKENTYYHDERAGRVYERRVIAQPGWAPALGGSMPAVALDHLCAR
jgi:acyl-coenzyme A thioesterase PaaI-like protein